MTTTANHRPARDLRRPAGPDVADDRGRQARPGGHLHPGRAVGALRPGAAGHAADRRGRRAGPVRAVQGARADGLLRRARGQGLRGPRGPARFRRVRLRPRAAPGPGPDPGGGDLQRIARPRAAAGGRDGPRAEGPGTQRTARVFVLVGDAELDEGSNHEAIAFARAARLDTLHVVVVDNASSTYGWPGGVEARFAVEGWSVRRVSGRDHDALEAALHRAASGPAAHGGRGRRAQVPRQARSPRPSAAHARDRRRSWRPCGNASPRSRAACWPSDPRLAVVLADISADSFRPAADPLPGPGDQRGDPGAAADQRGGRAVPGRDAADRAHVRQLPGRAAFRADQAGPEPPGRGRQARCWSARARPTTTPRTAGPISRQGTSRCWIRCPAGPCTSPGIPTRPSARSARRPAGTGWSTCGCPPRPTRCRWTASRAG